MIEIEKRGLLSELEYNLLRKKLQSESKFLGADDKYVEYLIYTDKLLKVVRNISKNNAMLSLKLNSVGSSSSYDETEIKIDESSFNDLQKIISHIAKPDQKIVGTQKRENYVFNEVEIAIKWSEDWGYHFELEYLIENEAGTENALVKISETAMKFDLKIMSETEERGLITSILLKKK